MTTKVIERLEVGDWMEMLQTLQSLNKKMYAKLKDTSANFEPFTLKGGQVRKMIEMQRLLKGNPHETYSSDESTDRNARIKPYPIYEEKTSSWDGGAHAAPEYVLGRKENILRKYSTLQALVSGNKNHQYGNQIEVIFLFHYT